MTKQTLTVLAMIAAAMAPLLLGGCTDQPQYTGPIDPARAALALGYMQLLQSSNAAMQNPFAGTMQPVYTSPRLTCTRQPLGLIPTVNCQ